ncbi:LysR family transcriptional regulator [Streptomyces sp. NPDC051940]|uniref:LysR family transcriptional regulator n=1 Tax=Streptomyces sp. NPDC051940 TaxID=3155675 RepID=UPI003424DC3D
MERHEIETFLTLSEELHFGRTAQRLRLSPARVTQIVQKLERRFGAPLFTRTSRAVALTDLGRRLGDELRPHHEAIEAAVRRAVDAGRGVSGALRLAFLGPATGQLLVTLADTFHARHPEAEARLVLEAEIGDPLRPLRDGRVDMMAIHLPVREPDLKVGPVLMRESRCMVVPAAHPLASRESVTVEDLAGEDVVVAGSAVPDYWLAHWIPDRTPSGRPVRVAHRVATFQAGLALIAAGKGIGIAVDQISRYFQRPGVAFVPVTGAPEDELALVWPADRESELVRAFARTAEEFGTARLDDVVKPG